MSNKKASPQHSNQSLIEFRDAKGDRFELDRRPESQRAGYPGCERSPRFVCEQYWPPNSP
jgi:hypothetical protein